MFLGTNQDNVNVTHRTAHNRRHHKRSRADGGLEHRVRGRVDQQREPCRRNLTPCRHHVWRWESRGDTLLPNPHEAGRNYRSNLGGGERGGHSVIDSAREAESLARIRDRVSANLSVDLQENYRLASQVAPHVDKLRYNPGHLHHHEKNRPVRDKVAFLAEVADQHDCAIRVGVNCGSVDPEKAGRFGDDSVAEMVESALEHCELLDGLGFTRYCVSLKDSDPMKVVDANRRFAASRPEVPLHLGVTEAGLPPEGVIKTRVAFEQLIARGIGDTIRVSLTLPNERKGEEIRVGRQILDDIARGRFRSVPEKPTGKLNIIPFMAAFVTL